MSFVSFGAAALVLATATALDLAPAHRRVAILLSASAIFYVLTSPHGAVWLVSSSALTYLVAARVHRRQSGRTGVWVVSLVVSLLVAMAALRSLGRPTDGPAIWGSAFGTPLGVSYVTFRLIGYLLDVAWGRAEPAPSAASFAAYVTFFPHVTSGPIQRWGEFADGLALPRPGYEALSAGMRLILLGLVKKFVIANRLGPLVDPGFADPAGHVWWRALAAVYAFPLQLYFDFSGLTDVARGASALFGVPAPLNFDRPFAARSVQEFWSRWHMSLTRWLRDYLFTPIHVALRGRGQVGLFIALTVNMMAVGIWHGLTPTFVVFGALNAIYLVASAWRRGGPKKRAARPLGRWRTPRDVLVTFHLMAVAFVFFRSESVSKACALLRSAVGFGAATQSATTLPATTAGSALTLAFAALLLWIESGGTPEWQRWWRDYRWSPVVRWSTYYLAVLTLLLGGSWASRTFIYARF